MEILKNPQSNCYGPASHIHPARKSTIFDIALLAEHSLGVARLGKGEGFKRHQDNNRQSNSLGFCTELRDFTTYVRTRADLYSPMQNTAISFVVCLVCVKNPQQFELFKTRHLFYEIGSSNTGF
jgi:hypothetical protein